MKTEFRDPTRPKGNLANTAIPKITKKVSAVANPPCNKGGASAHAFSSHKHTAVRSAPHPMRLPEQIGHSRRPTTRINRISAMLHTS